MYRILRNRKNKREGRSAFRSEGRSTAGGGGSRSDKQPGPGGYFRIQSQVKNPRALSRIYVVSLHSLLFLRTGSP